MWENDFKRKRKQTKSLRPLWKKIMKIPASEFYDLCPNIGRTTFSKYVKLIRLANKRKAINQPRYISDL